MQSKPLIIISSSNCRQHELVNFINKSTKLVALPELYDPTRRTLLNNNINHLDLIYDNCCVDVINITYDFYLLNDLEFVDIISSTGNICILYRHNILDEAIFNCVLSKYGHIAKDNVVNITYSDMLDAILELYLLSNKHLSIPCNHKIECTTLCGNEFAKNLFGTTIALEPEPKASDLLVNYDLHVGHLSNTLDSTILQRIL